MTAVEGEQSAAESPGTTAVIDFYFDFSSPYGYLAAQEIDAVAARHGRSARWRPFLIGAVFKRIGTRPLVSLDMKGPYAVRDLARSARRLGVPFRLPEDFPFMSIAACRLYYWLANSDPGRAKSVAKALLDRAFGEGQSTASPAAVCEVAAAQGIDPDAAASALKDPKVKEVLRREVDAAMAAGVFGSPFFIVDSEPFWGHDRLDHVNQWLMQGGW